VVIPLATQQYMLLQRNLVYTGITRGKKLVVLIGQRKALGMAVKNNRTENRFSGLLARLLVPDQWPPMPLACSARAFGDGFALPLPI
jgi:ATP-dependent exoDNAse (exonuclease V) alpha subunit